ncbi:MAG: DUF554 domain-containing protein [Desulfatibacillaceae bacterium]
MLGTIVNTATILAGSAIGIAAGPRLPERVKEILMQGLGLSVFFVGMSMALKTQNALLTVGCVLLGGLVGELLRIEYWLERVGERLKKAFSQDSGTFVDGFVTATLIYLVGAMTIVGCIEDGIANRPETLYIKALLDGVASLVLASKLGIGVAFSAVSVFVFQGALTLAASHLLFMQRPDVLAAVNSTGGVLIMGIAFILLEIKRIHTGNLLPAVVFGILGALWL